MKKFTLGSRISLLKGRLTILVKNAKTGEIISSNVYDNIQTLAGRRWHLESIQAGSGPAGESITHMAVGTSTVPAADTQTTLTTEIFRKAIASWDNTLLSANPPKVTAEMTMTSTEGNGNTLTEVGLFTAATAGTMLSRLVFPGQVKDNTLTIVFKYDLTSA